MKKIIGLLLLITTFAMFFSCKLAGKNAKAESIAQKWTLVSLSGFNNAVIKKTNGFIDFSSTRKDMGSAFAGCNKMFFSYKANNNNISISDVGATKMYCDGLIEIEASFANQLMKSKLFEINRNVLYLKDGENKVLITAIKDNN